MPIFDFFQITVVLIWMQTALWLEEKITDYEKTVIVVSHDRHFLNKVHEIHILLTLTLDKSKYTLEIMISGNNPVNYHVANMKMYLWEKTVMG